MLSCSELLDDYSDFRDGVVSPGRAGLIRAHLDTCPECARYDRVVANGVRTLRALPAIEPSDDFMPRLQHRIYHIDQGAPLPSVVGGSSVPVGLALLLVAGIAAAAWLPTVALRPALVELPAVAAMQPQSSIDLPPLFRSGPLLDRATIGTMTSNAANDLFFRYSPLGSQAPVRTATLLDTPR